ncbi:hypothetical protein [Flavobacterium capsici]|uniref:Uncharacterized protein n=1 Tax=Flavobacterium capsici TaxID=3075618 RepID=A0AA96EYK0_9FLAO|nr:MULTISPECIES: hypothetical protein [unclassified Flavobacterium]WNM19123.1 hypothetical protein RN608_00220 [Flavobacterium sp. PMR2A8]WNM20512.1 hypothetical protein RN605_07390 [Flavobacterium sp. PMTSA4]
MNTKTLLVFFITVLLFIQCKSSSNDEINEGSKFPIVDNKSVENGGYTDGEYCAEIEYYNPERGTNSTYTLVVEIENNELTIIHWPNGGWLDSTHFMPPDISEGHASFTSDTGAEYNITIIDTDCN